MIAGWPARGFVWPRAPRDVARLLASASLSLQHSQGVVRSILPEAAVRNPGLSLFLLMAVTQLGCNSSGEPPVLTPVALRILVADSVGTPVAGSFATWQVWPAPSIAAPQPDPLARTDSTGQWIIPLGGFPDGRWDSVSVHLYPPGCNSTALTVMQRRAELFSPSDTVPLTFVTPSPAAAVHTTAGQYCGFSVDTTFEPRYPDLWLSLRVDSASGATLAGRWRLDYNWTQGTEFGSFTGTYTANTLAMVLTHAAPWGNCTGFTLVATLDASGAWGPLEASTPQGCTRAPLRFDMAPSTLIDYWP